MRKKRKNKIEEEKEKKKGGIKKRKKKKTRIRFYLYSPKKLFELRTEKSSLTSKKQLKLSFFQYLQNSLIQKNLSVLEQVLFWISFALNSVSNLLSNSLWNWGKRLYLLNLIWTGK